MKTCFVICPIGELSSDIRKHSDLLLDYIIKPACSDYDVERSDMLHDNARISETIQRKLRESDLVIADLTKLNPNVFYEVGYRHALKRHLIPVAEYGTVLPFDLNDFRTIFYELKLGSADKTVEELRQTIANLKEVPEGGRPISDLSYKMENGILTIISNDPE